MSGVELPVPELTFDNIIMKLTQEYNRESFKQYEATLLVKSHPKTSIDCDDCIDFDKLFMKIDQYFNEEKFEMKGFIGSIADISESFVDKFKERYVVYIDKEVIESDKELKSPYYDELSFVSDLSEITKDKYYKPTFTESIKYDDKRAQDMSDTVYNLYCQLYGEYNSTIISENVLKFGEHIGKIEDFKSKVTTPFFYQQPLYSGEFKQEEVDGVLRLRTEFEMLLKYIESTYKKDCDCLAILKAVNQRIKSLRQ